MTIDELCAAMNAAGHPYTRDGNTLSAAGNLYLSRLTTLPEGVTLSAAGDLVLSSLTSERQRYQSQDITLRTIDDYCMRLIGSRDVGGVTLWSAQYFRGHLDTDPRCYVAQSGDDYAHGDTAEHALRDLRFKLDQRKLDPATLVAEIKARGVVRFNDYRLLTGACESGLREGLRARGKLDAEELPLHEALDLCAGAYGGAQFRKLMGETE